MQFCSRILIALVLSIAFAWTPLRAVTPPYTIAGMVWRSPGSARGFHEIALRRDGRFRLVHFRGNEVVTLAGRYVYDTGRAKLSIKGSKLSCSHQVDKAAGMRMYWSCDLPGGGESDFLNAKSGTRVVVQGRKAHTTRLLRARIRTRRAFLREKIGGGTRARLFRGRRVTTLARAQAVGAVWYFVVLKKRSGGETTGWVRASALRFKK